MTLRSGTGEANHDPGTISLSFMEDMGWTPCQGSLSTPDFTASDFRISPNPFNGQVTIELPNRLTSSHI